MIHGIHHRPFAPTPTRVAIILVAKAVLLTPEQGGRIQALQPARVEAVSDEAGSVEESGRARGLPLRVAEGQGKKFYGEAWRGPLRTD